MIRLKWAPLARHDDVRCVLQTPCQVPGGDDRKTRFNLSGPVLLDDVTLGDI